jgi:multiple sugar transport system substrate-binding protein
MEEFGYDIPTTWEEYLETGLRVAQEHPGYVVGACGDSQCHNAYFWPSQCPAHQDLGNNTLYINYLDDKCVRAANMLDQLMAAGSIMPAKGPFSTEFIEKANKNELLMFVGASWYGEHVFNGLYYTTPEGQLGVAAPLKWADETTNWTGAQGGSSWAVSRHTKNPELAMRLIQWLTTAPEYMGENGTTQPAFTANTEMWGKALADKPLYAFDTYPVLQNAGGLMDPLWNEPVRYSVAIGGAWEEVINEGLVQGMTIEELLPALQERMVQQAEAAAYLVQTAK